MVLPAVVPLYEPGNFCVRDITTAAYPDCRVSFEAARGQILGFAGLVGAGRGEMARAVFGVDQVLSGSITLVGRELQICFAKDAIKNGIYLVPENRRKPGLVVEMSFRENITLSDFESHAAIGLIKGRLETITARSQSEALSIKVPSVETLFLDMAKIVFSETGALPDYSGAVEILTRLNKVDRHYD